MYQEPCNVFILLNPSELPCLWSSPLRVRSRRGSGWSRLSQGTPGSSGQHGDQARRYRPPSQASHSFSIPQHPPQRFTPVSLFLPLSLGFILVGWDEHEGICPAKVIRTDLGEERFVHRAVQIKGWLSIPHFFSAHNDASLTKEQFGRGQECPADPHALC